MATSTEFVDHTNVQAHSQRPFIGRDTQTTREFFFELEAGGAVDPGDTSDLPVLLKYGLAPRTEFFVGTSPYRSVDRDGQGPEGTGTGDTQIGLRHRFRDGDIYSPALGFEVFTKLPTGLRSDGLGTGAMDFLGALMAEQTFYGVDVTGFYQLGLLGEAESTDIDYRHTVTLQGRRPMQPNLAVFGESAFLVESANSREELTLMGGMSIIYDDFTLFDLGLRVGISPDAPDLQLLFGLTRTLGLVMFDNNAPQ